MKISITFLFLALFLVSCGSKVIKTSGDSEGGTISYNNIDDLERAQFLKLIAKEIQCPESYVDISAQAYAPGISKGEFIYQCRSFESACMDEDGKACFQLGLLNMNKKGRTAGDFFTLACKYDQPRGCFFAGFLSQDPAKKKLYMTTACRRGYARGCLEQDTSVIVAPLAGNGVLEILDSLDWGENIQTTSDGLVYKILEKGKGKSPTIKNKVVVNYRGYLPDGKTFDQNTKGEPVEFDLNGLIEGWKKGLSLISEGGKIRLLVPAHLAYGEQGVPPRIPPSTPLLFDIELKQVK